MTTALAALLPLVVNSDESEKVRPGWIPLLIVLALGAFVAFLYFSLKKQLGRIDIPEGGVPTRPDKDDEDVATRPESPGPTGPSPSA